VGGAEVVGGWRLQGSVTSCYELGIGSWSRCPEFCGGARLCGLLLRVCPVVLRLCTRKRVEDKRLRVRAEDRCTGVVGIVVRSVVAGWYCVEVPWARGVVIYLR
jgi:hypothetical protein